MALSEWSLKSLSVNKHKMCNFKETSEKSQSILSSIAVNRCKSINKNLGDKTAKSNSCAVLSVTEGIGLKGKSMHNAFPK